MSFKPVKEKSKPYILVAVKASVLTSIVIL
jgi:hypothetical protein